jgi:hypothetical protein
LIVACAACGNDSPSTRSSECVPERLASSSDGTPNKFVRPSYVPAGFKVDVFEDRGPRRVVLTGKKSSGLVPVIDLQLFAPDPGAEVRAAPEIRQDGASKFSAKWDADNRTILATAAFVSRDEFDKVVKSTTLIDATEFCAFVREHGGRLFAADSAAPR